MNILSCCESDGVVQQSYGPLLLILNALPADSTQPVPVPSYYPLITHHQY